MGARTRVERRKGSSGGAGGCTGGGGGSIWVVVGVVVVGPQYSGSSVDSNEVGESTGK